MKATPEQSRAVAQVVEDWLSGKRTTTLTGGPGTGKTFVTGELVRQFTDLGCCVYIVAATNTAVGAVRDKGRKGNWLHLVGQTSTAHSLLGLVVTPDGLISTGNTKAAVPDVLIVDEGWQLNAAIIEKLEDEAKFIVYVGDDRQLLGVGEKESPIVCGDNQLTRNMRVSDPKLAKLTAFLREAVADPEIEAIPGNLIAPFITRSRDEWESLLDGEHTAIVFTNAEADRLNRIVRARLGRTAEYSIGDKVLFDGPWMLNRHTVFPSSTVGVVKEATRCDIQGYRLWNLRIEGRDKSGNMVERYVTVERTEGDSEQWNAYLKDEGIPFPNIAKLKFGWAITAHRSQGNEFEHVIVNMRDFQRSPEQELRKRMLNVAVSRAKETVLILVPEGA